MSLIPNCWPVFWLVLFCPVCLLQVPPQALPHQWQQVWPEDLRLRDLLWPPQNLHLYWWSCSICQLQVSSHHTWHNLTEMIFFKCFWLFKNHIYLLILFWRYSSSMKTLSNKFMHLTNYSINKNNAEYQANSDDKACQGHKWWEEHLRLLSCNGYLKYSRPW